METEETPASGTPVGESPIKEAAEGETTMGSKLYRRLVNIVPASILENAPMISKCCEPGEAEDPTVEHVISHTPRDLSDEKYVSHGSDVETATSSGEPENPSEDASAEENDRLVMRAVKEVNVNDVPSIQIGSREGSIKQFGDERTSAASTYTVRSSQRDPELIERAMLIFIDNSVCLAKRAITDNKLVLAEKLICGMLKRIQDVYGGAENAETDENQPHPYVRMMERLPKDTPTPVREAISVVAEDAIFMTSLVEKILVMDLIATFNMMSMKTHIQEYRQQFLPKLWPSAVETANYEMRHSKTVDMSARTDRQNEVLSQDTERGRASLSSSPRIVTRREVKHVSMAQEPLTTERRQMKKPSRYLAYASRIIGSRKNTMFGQHFSKNKVRTADGWVKEPYRTLETYYRFEGNGSVSVKVRGKLSTDLIRVLCIINETDLSAEWVPFLKDASNVHVFSKTTKLFQQQYEYPVVGAKNTTVFGIAINALEESGCYILGCRGPPETAKDVEQLQRIIKDEGIEDATPFVDFKDSKCTLWGLEVEPIPPKVRQKSADLCFLLYPMERHTLVELYANITPEVKLVPARIVTYIIKKVVVTIFKKIAQISKNFENTPFMKRKEENVEFYEWIAKVLEDYRGRGGRKNCNISICTYDTACNDC